MADILELTLPNGKSVFVEVEGRSGFEAGGDINEMGAEKGGPKNVATAAFDIVSSTLTSMAENIEDNLAELKEKRPDQVVMEVAAKVKAGGNIFITSGSAEGNIKLQMTWEK